MGRHKNRVSLPTDPIYKSTKCAYFSSMKVIPPYDYYAFIDLVPEIVKYRWDVNVGDAIAIDLGCDAKSICDNYYPYNSPWWPAVVVSIFKKHKDKNNEIKLEVRWLNKTKDLMKASSTSKDDDLVETDHIDEIDAISLLGPVTLSKKTIPKIQHFEILPTKKFTCNKFWSHAKNSIQSEVTNFTLEGRRERGILYSKHAGYKRSMQQNTEKVGDVRKKCDEQENASKKRKECIGDDSKVVSP